MNILSLIEASGISVQRVASTKGGEYAGPCPLCGGEDRFRAWPEQGEGGRWWCRGCGRSGDMIQYLRDVRKMTFREACQYVGRELPARRSFLSGRKPHAPHSLSGGAREAQTKPDITNPDLWATRARSLVEGAVYNLWHFRTDHWLRWLKEKRGLAEGTVQAYSLGLQPKDRFDYPKDWGLEPVFKENGQAKKVWVPRGFIIPLFDGDRVVRVKFRRPKSAGKPHYYLLKGSDSRPRVINPESSIFVVVENELDAMLLAQEVSDLGVGVVALGSASVKPDSETAEILRRCRLVLVALDFDQAGNHAWVWWRANFPQAHSWPPIGGKDVKDVGDVGEMWEAGVDLKDWVKVGIDVGLGKPAREEGAHAPQGEVGAAPPGSEPEGTPAGTTPEDVSGLLDLALAGKLTKPVWLPVAPRFQEILGPEVFLCPDRATMEAAPGLAFIPEELGIVLPLLHENPEFAQKLVLAKQVLGGRFVAPGNL